MKYTQDEVEEKQDYISVAAMSAVTMTTLDTSWWAKIDEKIVLQKIALEDPVYQLLMSQVTKGDWGPHKSQEPIYLQFLYSMWDRLVVFRGQVTYIFSQGCV